jgi:hypothetical protein
MTSFESSIGISLDLIFISDKRLALIDLSPYRRVMKRHIEIARLVQQSKVAVQNIANIQSNVS